MEDTTGASSKVGLAGAIVLVVEDEAVIMSDLTMTIEDRDGRVVGAYSVRAALSLLTGSRPDAAILDVDIGGEDVFPVAELLVALRVPFVFHSGRTARQTISGRYPGVEIVSKPALSDDVANALEEIMASAGSS